MTIFVTWQLIVTLDSIHNSCDVYYSSLTYYYMLKRATVVQNEVQVKKNISLAVHTSFESSVRYDSETVDEKIWHWDLLASWKNMAFLEFFWPFLMSFSLSRAVSACFWHCIWHLPTPDICLTHSDTILTLPDTLRHHPDTHQTPPYLACMRPLGERVISDYHDIYSTGFNLQYIYTPQTSAWHTQTPSRHCQTPWDTIQTP